MADYPTSKDLFDRVEDYTSGPVLPKHKYKAADINNLQAWIEALEDTLGLGIKMGYDTVKLFFDSLLTTISGLLPKSGGTMTGVIDLGGNHIYTGAGEIKRSSMVNGLRISASGDIEVLGSLIMYDDISFAENKYVRLAVGCCVGMNSDQSIPNITTTLIDFKVADNDHVNTYDIGNNWDDDTHKFTCPVNGYYRVTCMYFITVIDNERATIAVFIDGADSSVFNQTLQSGSRAITPYVSQIMKLASGKTIEFRAYQQGGAAKNIYHAYSSASIELCGKY